MKCQRAFLLVVLLALTFRAMASEQILQRAQSAQIESASASARKALQTFAALVTRENYGAMGFDSPDQVRSATLGVPVEQYVIGLDDVLRYKSPSDVTQSLKATDRLTFPVLVGGRARSSVTLRRQNDRWEAESFGAPQYMRMLSEVRDRLAAEKNRPLSEYFEVRIPALNLTFLGQVQDARLFLALVHDAPGIELKRGVLVSAEEVMKAIEPMARAHNRLPT